MNVNKYKVVERSIHGSGEQRIYRFPNGLGASVIRHVFSYGGANGLWELAVIKWKDPAADDMDWQITYATSITPNVLGRLSDDDVQRTLREIADLKGDQQ